MRQVVIVGFASIGMTFIIAIGAIDLSVGSLVALCTVTIALVLRAGHSPVLALAVGILTGIAGSFLNGILVSKMKVGPFIVTLASLMAYRGIAKGLANEQMVNVGPSWLQSFTAVLHKGERWMLMPRGAWLMIALAIFANFIFHRTVFGRNVIAVGSNAETARLCGLDPSKTMLKTYLFAGIFFGIAGLMQFSRLAVQGDPTASAGLELDVIAACVIGGSSLAGGVGSVYGSLIGALILVTFASGCSILGLSNWIQQLITPVIIVIAVALDRWRHAKLARAG